MQLFEIGNSLLAVRVATLLWPLNPRAVGSFPAKSRGGGIMKYNELTLGQIEAVVNKLGGMEGVKKFLSGDFVIRATKNLFRLTVNYDRSVEDGIRAGKYDSVDSRITSGNFPATQKGIAEITVEFIHFGRVVSTDDVLREFDQRCLRPATLPELLAFGEKYPDVQREFPIIAFSSVIENWLAGYGIPCLGRHDAKRSLFLRWFESDCFDDCRFAGIRIFQRKN